jgi:hypothetical protein
MHIYMFIGRGITHAGLDWKQAGLLPTCAGGKSRSLGHLLVCINQWVSH